MPTEPIANHYTQGTAARTTFGVAASLLSMGIPIGLVELIRPMGDMHVVLWSAVATVGFIISAYLSIRGTLEE